MADQSAPLTSEQPAVGASKQDQLLQTILSAAFAAMLVATPLMPSDTYSLAIDGQIAAPAMLWLMLAICATAAGLLRILRTPKSQIRFTLCDLLLGVFFLWSTLAATIASADANRRTGWNMSASWVSLGLTYYLARLLLREGTYVRAIIAGIVAVGVMFAVEGMYESWVVIPNSQARFRQNPAAVFAEAGISAERGSVAYEQFRSRLQTQRPSATFVLENSLAGFLVPVVILALGMFLGSNVAIGNERSLLRKLTLGICIAALGYGVYLTGSTAGIIAMGVCVLVGAVDILFRDQTRSAKMMRYGALAALIVIFVWPLLAGFTGETIASALPRTLKYRVEYWQSCAAMLAHYPLWGCGPGNFQDAYPRFMLPQAAETIADPHNLIWEVFCTAGSLSGLLFLIALLVPCRSIISSFVQGQKLQSTDQANTIELQASLKALALGGLAGIPLAMLLSLSSGSNFLLIFLRSWLLLGALPCVAVIFVLMPWIRRGSLSTSLIWLAWLALAIHLTVSGGISNPGTGTLFFLLLAFTQIANPQEWTLTFKAGVIAGLTALGLLVAAALGHYFVGYVPVLASHAAIIRSDVALAASNRGEGKEALKAAASADAWSATPYSRLAIVEFQEYVESSKDRKTDAENLMAAVREASSKAKSSPTIQYEMAITLLTANSAAPNEAVVKAAKELLQKTIDLAPSKAVAWAYLAYVNDKLGDLKGAGASAKEALRLDLLNPHEQYDLEREPCPIPGRSFPGWLRELAETSPTK